MADKQKSNESQVKSSADQSAKPRWRKFPGPRGSGEKNRIYFERQAFADLIAQAKESLNAEICGVLIGEGCEDDEGTFLHIEATIPGTSARQGSTHVTFTQETWNQIHQQKEKSHPKKQIVGWYHTHPGFGVEFSEMDLFIQRNFFSGPLQIAFVTDPLGGEEAILANDGSGGVTPVRRYWVDGRERRTAGPPAAKETSAVAAQPATSDRSLRAIEERLSQLVLAVEAQQNLLYRFLTGVGMLVGAAVIVWIGSALWSNLNRDYKPPEINASWVPVPVQVDGKAVMLGVGVVKWEVPKKLQAAFVQVERERQAAEEEARRRAAATQAATQPSTAAAGN